MPDHIDELVRALIEVMCDARDAAARVRARALLRRARCRPHRRSRAGCARSGQPRRPPRRWPPDPDVSGPAAARPVARAPSARPSAVKSSATESNWRSSTLAAYRCTKSLRAAGRSRSSHTIARVNRKSLARNRFRARVLGPQRRQRVMALKLTGGPTPVRGAISASTASASVAARRSVNTSSSITGLPSGPVSGTRQLGYSSVVPG